MIGRPSSTRGCRAGMIERISGSKALYTGRKCLNGQSKYDAPGLCARRGNPKVSGDSEGDWRKEKETDPLLGSPALAVSMAVRPATAKIIAYACVDQRSRVITATGAGVDEAAPPKSGGRGWRGGQGGGNMEQESLLKGSSGREGRDTNYGATNSK